MVVQTIFAPFLLSPLHFSFPLALAPSFPNSCSSYNAPMTRTRYRIRETEYPYFLTCTVVGWLLVFTRPEAVRILFDCWRFLQQNRDFRLSRRDER